MGGAECWDERKDAVMEACVRSKFSLDPVLASLLVATGDRMLVEGNTWGDKCWGMVRSPHDVSAWEGENRWMRMSSM